MSSAKVSSLLFAGSVLVYRASSTLISRGTRAASTSAASPLKITVLGSDADKECLSVLSNLPPEAKVISQGPNLEALLSQDPECIDAEVLLVASGTPEVLSEVMRSMKKLKWVHGIFAGLDHMRCPEFDNCSDLGIVVTNAKGVFSSSLAEWVLGACWYFNKNIPRLNENKKNKLYDRYTVGELRGKTMGVIGYGDIGRACATLARAYGMRIVAHRRRPEMSYSDPLVDSVYGNSDINQVMCQADFLVVAAALTAETKGMLGHEQFIASKEGQVLINIGRGNLLDEKALIAELRSKRRIHAAALDVFCIEPLPESSALWTLPNVLLSPHNADMTEGFRHASVAFFVENCKAYLKLGHLGLQNIVNPKEGY